ncbi:hypothetical protein ETAA8_71260 [Anatilimnocola aggregata]|uniref:VapC45 PIN like domain-containing protein n=1 Tax=Anatilimnocola aggregata TaxID=2528021 RepID=A0A517YP17_9BACT|nr:hypothetical protein [Anatilimnocola aggregata]QDU31964.1 hypothetical protein ETAA8_71260 [Anatilimnocola aggregata]
MRILVDECVPRPFARQFPEHVVSTIVEQGWAGKKNGELLGLMAAAGWEALITVDQNLRYQQNLTGTPVAVLVLLALSNRLTDLLPLVGSAKGVLQVIQPGQVIEVIAPTG